MTDKQIQAVKDRLNEKYYGVIYWYNNLFVVCI